MSELEKLRDELIEFEKIIAEFQKWKLIGIGAVFAAGLGLSESLHGNSPLALLAVPMLTVYADFLIRDYDIRLCLIARYMRPRPGEFGEYERFLSTAPTRGRHWVFGHLASAGSSILANGAVIWLACASGIVKSGGAPNVSSILVISAVIGIVLAILTYVVYISLVRRIFDKSKEPPRVAERPSRP